MLVDPKTGDVTLEYGPAMMWNTKYGMMSGTAAAGTGSGGMMGGSLRRDDGPRLRWDDGRRRDDGRPGDDGRNDGAPRRDTELDARRHHRPRQRRPGSRACEQLARRSRAAGLTAGEPDAFPGYFTMETLKNGKVTGMISVNAKTGAVFYHWWHGTFVAMEE